MPDDKAQAHYTGAAGARYHFQKRGIPEIAVPWVARLRAEKFQDHIGARDTVLEYGVGAGWNLAELSCKRRLGFDIAEFLGPQLRALGIEVIETLSRVSPGSIDIVICHHTLEHVINPAETLHTIHGLLRPGGTLLLFVPFEKERHYRRYNPTEPNHHLYSWNAQTLGNLVTDCGFAVIDAGIGEFGYDRFAAHWANRMKLGEAGFRAIRRMVHCVRPGCEVRLVAEKK